MILEEAYKLKSLLDSFLGDSKNELNESYQLEYPCPRCVENYGKQEIAKFNLSVSISKGVYQCWKCCQHDSSMHGSIIKLIKTYGNETILKEYLDTLEQIKSNKLYSLHLSENDFKADRAILNENAVSLPQNYRKFSREAKNGLKALNYLNERNIKWNIIDEFNIGYTEYDKNSKQLSSRIIIPSYDKYGVLNYWTGRDFTSLAKRQKYYNPRVERKDIIFNEMRVQWDADVTLVEGPFDHIVVPNSIPLLGKVLSTDFYLYREIVRKANANINIFLDGDAVEDVKKIYGLLNHNGLYGRIRYIPISNELDPSKIYEIYGEKGIIKCLKNASKIKEVYLT